MKLICLLIAIVFSAQNTFATECTERVKEYAEKKLKEMTGDAHSAVTEPEAIISTMETSPYVLTLQNQHTGQNSTWVVDTTNVTCEPISISAWTALPEPVSEAPCAVSVEAFANEEIKKHSTANMIFQSAEETQSIEVSGIQLVYYKVKFEDAQTATVSDWLVTARKTSNVTCRPNALFAL